MATVDTIEGVIGDGLSFHYDVFADVLYLRRLDELATPEVGEEDEQGLITLYAQDDLRPIGLTIVSFWKRFGEGEPADSNFTALADVIDHSTSRFQSRILAA